MVGSPRASLPRILTTSTPETGRTDTVFVSAGVIRCGQRLFFQRGCKKVVDPLFRVGRGLRIVPFPIDRVLESVSGIGVNLEIDGIPVSFYLLLEFADGLGRDSLVLAAKITQHLCFDGFNLSLRVRQLA